MIVSPHATTKSSPWLQTWSLSRILKDTSPLGTNCSQSHSSSPTHCITTPFCQLSPAPMPRIQSWFPQPASNFTMTRVSFVSEHLPFLQQAFLDSAASLGAVADFFEAALFLTVFFVAGWDATPASFFDVFYAITSFFFKFLTMRRLKKHCQLIS